ncbi:MAG TPA: hypothetical protein VFS00_01055, partial [Polyangiaceae bacterium]|nr:hypothetical protein [Polyangiaceae bacterium]
GPYTPSLYAFAEQYKDTYKLRERILGVVPGAINPVFNAFRSKYGSSYDIREADTSGAANAYDAVYLLAYSVVALGEAPVTGASLAQAMKRLVPPAQVTVDAGPLNINTAYTELSGSRNINFNGASGPLDFDLETGDPNSDMQIWCLDANNTGKNSGTFYDAMNVLEGSMDQIRDSCGILGGVTPLRPPAALLGRGPPPRGRGGLAGRLGPTAGARLPLPARRARLRPGRRPATTQPTPGALRLCSRSPRHRRAGAGPAGARGGWLVPFRKYDDCASNRSTRAPRTYEYWLRGPGRSNLSRRVLVAGRVHGVMGTGGRFRRFGAGNAARASGRGLAYLLPEGASFPLLGPALRSPERQV